jgi:hypothetical protein
VFASTIAKWIPSPVSRGEWEILVHQSVESWRVYGWGRGEPLLDEWVRASDLICLDVECGEGPQQEIARQQAGLGDVGVIPAGLRLIIYVRRMLAGRLNR